LQLTVGIATVKQTAFPACRVYSSTLIFQFIVMKYFSLTRFYLQSETGSGYEFGDDGIVPSTPTLQVPQRSDGFAEAVS